LKLLFSHQFLQITWQSFIDVFLLPNRNNELIFPVCNIKTFGEFSRFDVAQFFNNSQFDSRGRQ